MKGLQKPVVKFWAAPEISGLFLRCHVCEDVNQTHFHMNSFHETKREELNTC